VKRTQIYLEEDLDRRLREAASLEGRSAADLIREALRDYLAAKKGVRSRDPFLALAGRFRGGPRDGAANHDKYLYRRKRR
jgi:plasmid stability protein